MQRCKLCLKEKEIRNSHYLPKGMYKFLREATLKNPNPILAGRGAAVQVSDQITGHMLCDDCEDLFDKNGENLVVNKMARIGSFPLWETIRAATPIFGDGDTAMYASGSIPGLNMAALTYFGMSVFWRGAACQWRDRRGPIGGIKLGPYEERIRQFLLKTGSFPNDVALIISVSPKDDPIVAAFTPSEAERRAYHAFLFYVPGIQFVLAAGKGLNEEMKGECAYSSSQKPIFASHAVERNARRALRGTIEDAFLAKGMSKTLQEVASIRSKTASKE